MGEFFLVFFCRKVHPHLIIMRLLLINPNTNTETTREMVHIALHEAEGSGTAVNSYCMHLKTGVFDLSIYPKCPDLRIVCVACM